MLNFDEASTAGRATITNNDGIIFFSGVSSGGTAQLIANGLGVVDFSPLLSGGTTVGSLEGSGNFFLGSKTITVGGNNLSTEVSGNIHDGGACCGTGGAIVKEGTGTLTLSGINTYTGPTTVDAGALVVNGSIATSSGLTVDAGALVGGVGILPSTTINGALSPGNSIGTITVNGNLAFGAGSFYLVEISPTAADRTNVTGTATLSGAVLASFAPGQLHREAVHDPLGCRRPWRRHFREPRRHSGGLRGRSELWRKRCVPEPERGARPVQRTLPQ
ncbi:MAG: autotransporter-associated beta strand repeat-containing protein [Rhodoplanes sp.]